MPEEPKPSSSNPIQGQNIINVPINLNTQLIYTNGSIINMTQTDVQISFSVNGRPVIATAMTWSMAKNLQTSLLRAVSEYERKTNSIIPDINEVAEQLKKP
jgi:hypothetical protein